MNNALLYNNFFNNKIIENFLRLIIMTEVDNKIETELPIEGKDMLPSPSSKPAK